MTNENEPSTTTKELWHGFWDEDDDGKPERELWRGPEWIPAEQKFGEILSARFPETRHASLGHFRAAWASLRVQEIEKKWGKEAESKPRRRFSRRELRRFLPAMLEAMEQRDETLFRDLARLSKVLFRPDYQTNEERVLQAAFDLREEFCDNPSRNQVKWLVLNGGVKIDEKDWSGYFKRCRLEFLAKARPGRKSVKARGKAM